MSENCLVVTLPTRSVLDPRLGYFIMLQTIVLRFNDYYDPTVELHVDIINASGHVWWGWWKKSHEKKKTDLLDVIASKCPIKVGLVNRGEKQYYEANCTQIVADSSGTPIASPEASLTPSYYRNKSVPAWLKLSSITLISKESFRIQFGGMPDGDDTLFAVEQTPEGKIHLNDLNVHFPDYIEAPGQAILHLSDLHFGGDHAFAVRDENHPTDRTSLATMIAKRMQDAGHQIGVVVVSGDFITKAEPEAFEDAYKFLDALATKLKLTHEHFVLTPGNHDFKVISGTDDVIDHKHERAFREFYNRFFRRYFDELERLQAFELSSGWKLRFLALNSARPRGLGTTMNYGYVGSQRYNHLLETIVGMQKDQVSNDPSISKTLNCVVLHHHLINVAKGDPRLEHPVSVTLDSAEMLEDFCKANINCVLHGHQHVPFGTSVEPIIIHDSDTWITHKRRIIILGAGSAGAKLERLNDRIRENSYSIYIPSEQGLRLEIEKYNPTVSPSVYRLRDQLPY